LRSELTAVRLMGRISCVTGHSATGLATHPARVPKGDRDEHLDREYDRATRVDWTIPANLFIHHQFAISYSLQARKHRASAAVGQELSFASLITLLLL
jgi:hypothetical protein